MTKPECVRCPCCHAAVSPDDFLEVEYDPDSGASDPYDESWRDNEIDERGLPEIPEDDSEWGKS